MAFKGKVKKNVSIIKEGEKITCKHYSREGHDEAHCWKLHLKMRPRETTTRKNKKQLQPLNRIWDPIEVMN